MTLEDLYKIIEDRKNRMPKDSYVASLFKEGKDKIIQKVGEESVEVLIAAKGKNKQRVVSEMADLWYHCLVLLVKLNIEAKDILDELDKRRK